MISVVRIASRVARTQGRTAVAAAAGALGPHVSAIAPLRCAPAAAAPAAAARAFHATPRAHANIWYDTEETAAVIGKPAPTFETAAVIDGEIEKISLEQYKGKWTVLLFYPKDFTFVCPTEIIAFSDRHDEFEKLNAQVLAISTDTEECHLAWTKVPRKKGGLGHMKIPLVADTTKSIAADYGVLITELGIALRGLFIINPDGVLEQITINGLPVGRSVDETLRLLAAYQFVAEHGEVCPAGWTPGGKTMKADAEGSLEYFSTVEGEGDVLAASDKVKVIKTPQDYKNVIKEGKAVVDFVAPYCGKCRQIMPYVNELSEKYQDVTFAKFDTTEDALVELSADLGVQALPAFHFFNNGKPVGTPVTGYKKKALQAGVEALRAEK
eukprot:TRINITY_DN3272_c0_g1_i1.p2 TRINITY_DN3272_c0_g1~~TRINITY_DN3272_c0_g1_i1.p2  ORF type:complete len:391 (-),score=159.30 TRINITY_DN3272_c0_g1_i1:801-1949(-)